MSVKKVTSSGNNSRDERGDPSVKALKVTIAVCLVGLFGVYLFGFAPKKEDAVTSTPPKVARPEAKEAVAKFDRDSLSTKSR